ncbi:hypothetical protein CEXT_160451 [Caerostris extrusa]|uniref:Uncharacterized protein n=1 Tax=Caerostris extrusa TaxID=172846 RepID=A0AAV4PJ75_CAEEX|nr:hypothetical protein CEXT_160451 [Caerostris extrusa]
MRYADNQELLLGISPYGSPVAKALLSTTHLADDSKLARCRILEGWHLQLRTPFSTSFLDAALKTGSPFPRKGNEPKTCKRWVCEPPRNAWRQFEKGSRKKKKKKDFPLMLNSSIPVN